MIKKFIIHNALILHSGSLTGATTLLGKIKTMFLSKIGASYKLALIGTPFIKTFELITAWTIENSVYIGWVCWAIFVDWIVGIGYHLKKKTFDWGKNAAGLSLKILMALFAGSLFEALPYFLKGQELISEILLTVTRLAVFLYPAGSAWMNMAELTNGAFPPAGWTKRLKKFYQNLNINAFEQEEEKKEL